ncbi:guanylate kinase [bacterium]|nr:guanylate kinase [bacterium]
MTRARSSVVAGRLFVVSGPAGVGKGTVIQLLRKRRPDLALSVSATTRSPRPGEVEGVSYYFMDDEAFQQLVREGGFLEWAKVHTHYYGTPRQQVESKLRDGSLILEIDPQGAFNVRRAMPDAVLIFIAPPSIDELRRRLAGRGTESGAEFEKRMQDAAIELEASKDYDEVIVNDQLETTVDELAAIMERYEHQ